MRLKSQLTQAQLAANVQMTARNGQLGDGRASLSRTSIADYEGDRTRPRGELARDLARILGCSAEWLMTGREVRETLSEYGYDGAQEVWTEQGAQNLSIAYLVGRDEAGDTSRFCAWRQDANEKGYVILERVALPTAAAENFVYAFGGVVRLGLISTLSNANYNLHHSDRSDETALPQELRILGKAVAKVVQM